MINVSHKLMEQHLSLDFRQLSREEYQNQQQMYNRRFSNTKNDTNTVEMKSYGTVGSDNNNQHVELSNIQNKYDVNKNDNELDTFTDDYSWVEYLWGLFSKHILSLCNLHSTSNSKLILGIVLALICGILSSYCYIPYLFWKNDHRSDIDDNDLYVFNYVLSFTLGGFIFSSFCFITMIFYNIYCYYFRQDLSKYSQIKLTVFNYQQVKHSFVSGILYGIGFSFFVLATGPVSYTVVYVITLIGTIMISNLWSLYYFKEVTTPISLRLLRASIILMSIGVILEAIAD